MCKLLSKNLLIYNIKHLISSYAPAIDEEIKKESRKDAPIASQVLNVAKDRGVAIGYKHSAVALHHETKEDKRYLQNDNKNRDVNIDRVVDIAYNHSGVAFQHETKEDIRYLQNDTNNRKLVVK
jgi:hypothetical protein